MQATVSTSNFRIGELRRRCLDRKLNAFPRDPVAEARSLQASIGQPWQVRSGYRTRDRLVALRLELDELELLVGRAACPLADYPPADLAAAEEFLRREYPWPGGQGGHCELDLTRLLEVGIGGLRNDLENRLQSAFGEAADTCRSFALALDGLQALVEQAAAVASAAIPSAPPSRQAELRTMAAACRQIVDGPPLTFHQALQLLWLVLLAVQAGDHAHLIGPGHLDRTVHRFYAADLAAGRLDAATALELIECLYLLVNELTPNGLAVPVMVGGRDAAGANVDNDLSYLCLEALRRTRLVYPTVGVCWHEATPPRLVELAVELIGQGYSTPAFFGDATIQRGLRQLGVPAADACNYINSTCVEITPAGGSNVWVASPYFSTCRFLLDEIDAQVAAGPAAAADFATFMAAYQRRLVDQIAAAVADQNRTREARRQRGRRPLQSLFTRDCLERGRDLDDGGARYNWVECSFVGVANLVDSLAVLRREVYADRRLSLADLKSLLDANFANHEADRQRFLNAYPKYGNGDPEVDALVADLTSFFVAACRAHRMLPDDSPFVPGMFCWVMHERLGRDCGATPDGRQAGFPFADGCGPAQGREKCGPTAAILSTTSWNQAPMIGGAAYNMKFNRSLFDGPDAFARLRDLVLTFLRRGGFETQINVVDHECLRQARQHPEHYRDLVVRIGGYTDYFTRLSPEMQDEVMMRTQFERL